MNIRDLEYITAIAELRSFSKAARECHVSQPTLSTQIKKLEEELGISLFERSNRRVQLTKIGQEVLQIARRILRDEQEIRRITKSAQDPLGGTLHLCAIPTLSSYIFPQIVERIRQELPNTKLVLSEERTETLVQKLMNGEVDFGLLALPVHEPSLASRKLFSDPFLLAVPKDHELASKRSIDFETLSRFHLLLLEDGHCLGDQALSLCAAHGFGVDSDFRATSLETLKQMVIAGTGITLVPQIASRLEEPGLKYLNFTKTELPKREIGITWRKTMQRAEMLEKLCAIFAGLNSISKI